jgi:hypothetical protein
MFKDFTIFLWLLKLGALVNLYFLATTYALPWGAADPHIVIPAQIFFAVSAYRCLFPVWYKNNIVFHGSPLSSIFLTRLFATFSEVAYIYLLSHVLRLLNVEQVGWVNAFSWLMVLQVVISQGFVWGAILTRRLVLYYYEELGWANIFALNTIASISLYWTVDTLGGREILLQLNLLFGIVYLPWQLFHLRALRSNARKGGETVGPDAPVTWQLLAKGLAESIHARNQTSDADAWGGFIGLTWMAAYWATLLPMWLNHILGVLSSH